MDVSLALWERSSILLQRAVSFWLALVYTLIRHMFMYTHTYTHPHTHIHTGTHTHTHTHWHTHTPAHTHTHTHTHTYTQVWEAGRRGMGSRRLLS